MEKENKPLKEKEVETFLMDHSESMPKVIIQEIKQGFLTKDGDKIIWNERFRIRLQEIQEVEQGHKQAVRETYKELIFNEDQIVGREIRSKINNRIKQVFKNKLGFEGE